MHNWNGFTFWLQVLQNILETETEYSKDLQSLLTNYLRPLQSTDKYDSQSLIKPGQSFSILYNRKLCMQLFFHANEYIVTFFLLLLEYLLSKEVETLIFGFD